MCTSNRLTYIAVFTTPTALTDALPRLVTKSVHTTGVRNTLIAWLPRPTQKTSTRSQNNINQGSLISNLLSLYEHYEKAFSSIPNKTQGIVVVVYLPALKRFVAIPTATVTLLSANRCNNKNSNIYWKKLKIFNWNNQKLFQTILSKISINKESSNHPSWQFDRISYRNFNMAILWIF